MKKTIALVCAALCLLLTACGGNSGSQSDTPARPFQASDVTSILASNAFSEELEELDADLVCTLYGLDEAMITGCTAHLSTGASAEEVVLFTVGDEANVQAVRTACEKRVADQAKAYASYLPGEVTKLDKAILEVRGTTVLLVVANDAAAARAAIDALV